MLVRKKQTFVAALSVYMVCICALLLAQTEKKEDLIPKIDVKSYKIDAELVPETHEIKAQVEVAFQILEPTEYIILELHRNIEIEEISDEKQQDLDFDRQTDRNKLVIKLGGTAPAGSSRALKLRYVGTFDKGFSYRGPSDEGYVYIGDEGSYLLYSARWYPVNNFLRDRATFEVRVTVPLGVTVVGTGQAKPVVTKGINETFTWISDGEIVSNSIFAARFFEKTLSAGSIQVTFLLSEKHIERAEALRAAIEDITRYYEQKFGAYPFGNQLKLVEIQDAVRDKSGAPGLLVLAKSDLDSSKTPTVPLARSLGYQWWLHGMRINSLSDIWIPEGLSYYSPALYFEEKHGSEAFQNELVELATLALKFESKAPVAKAIELGYASELYESIAGGKGAWVFHMLRNVLGQDKFAQVLRQLFTERSSKTVATSELETLASASYGKSISWFFNQWVGSIGIPDVTADYTILKTKSGFKIRGSIKQDLDLFRMPVEVEIEMKNKKKLEVVELQGKSTAFEIEVPEQPLRLNIDPANKILRSSESLKIAVHIALGRRLFEKQQYVDAIREFNEAIRLNPRSSLAHFRLAETLYEQWNYQSAANSFRDALNGDLKPSWIEVWCYIYLGKIYDVLGQRQRALAEYNKAINTKDNTFDAQEEARRYLNTPFTRERPTDGK